MTIRALPTEAFECKRLVAYMKMKRLKFHHSPNETASQRQGTKNKLLGTSPGFPDYLIVLPKGGFLFVEMKRATGAKSKVSPQQKQWLEVLTAAGARAIVCYGFLQARAAIEEMIGHG